MYIKISITLSIFPFADTQQQIKRKFEITSHGLMYAKKPFPIFLSAKFKNESSPIKD